MDNFLAELRRLLAKGEDLPTLPRVVMELQEALDDELASGARIAEIINRDPPLATRLLRVANSAAFNYGAPIGDVTGAIQRVGLRQVRLLCTALSVINVFNQRQGVLDHRAFWRHSSSVAMVARSLAQSLGFRGVRPDELYVGGLLHDVGLLLLDQNFPDRLGDALDIAAGCEEPLWRLEHFVMGTDHGEIGGLLLERWALPSAIVAMVSGHHHPETTSDAHRDGCWLVFAAELICSGFGAPIGIEQLPEGRAVTILDAVREADFDVEAMMSELTGATDEFVTALA